MSPELRDRLEKITLELKRRKREERLRYFVPVKPTDPNAFGVPSNDQESFFTCDARERWIFGGNRSGKTEAAVADCLWFALGKHPVWSKVWEPPVKIRYCAPSYEDSIKGVILVKFQEMTPRHELKTGDWDTSWSEKGKTLYLKNGSHIRFMSFEQRPNKFGGADLHAVYSDEHGSKRHYRENKARLADYNGFFVSSMTPEDGSIVWEKQHIKRRRGDHCEVWKFSTFGNPHLSPAGVEEMKRSITDERVLRVKMYGDFAALAGLIYEEFNQSIHVLPRRDIPSDWYRICGIDPHLKKDTAILWGAYSPDGELFIYRAHKVHMTVDELKRFIRVKSEGEKINLFLADEAHGGEGTNIFGERSVIDQLNSGEDRIPVIGTNQGSDKSFQAGINKVREMLQVEPVSGKPSLFLVRGDSDIDGVIDEFDEYQFIPDSPADEMTFRERVRKIDDDYMDIIRYMVMAGPGKKAAKIRSALDGKW